jgi:hypothetical protein
MPLQVVVAPGIAPAVVGYHIALVVAGYHIDPGVGVDHTDFVLAVAVVGSELLT